MHRIINWKSNDDAIAVLVESIDEFKEFIEIADECGCSYNDGFVEYIEECINRHGYYLVSVGYITASKTLGCCSRKKFYEDEGVPVVLFKDLITNTFKTEKDIVDYVIANKICIGFETYEEMVCIIKLLERNGCWWYLDNHHLPMRDDLLDRIVNFYYSSYIYVTTDYEILHGKVNNDKIIQFEELYGWLD